MTVISALVVVFAYIAVIGALFYTGAILFRRFYQNLYSDEGYLTFTLPVRRGELLAAKTANALIWLTAYGVLVFVCLVIVALLCSILLQEWVADFWTEFGAAIQTVVQAIWHEVGAWFILYGVEIVLLLVLSTLVFIAQVHLCITFGALVAKRRKLLCGLGLYYGINFVFQLVGSFALSPLLSGFDILLAGMTDQGSCVGVALLLFVACVIELTIALTLYFLTQCCMERKLNLA